MTALFECWKAGGPLMVPLAALCLATSFWIATLYPRLHGLLVSFAGLMSCVEGSSSSSVAKAVRAWGRDHAGPLARITTYAMEGREDARSVRDRFTEARRTEIPRMGREVQVLMAMVAAAPLLGLLGTVKGMIEAFEVLAVRGTASMEFLSAGISEALVTTQVGLIVALPGLIGVHAIRRRLIEVDGELDRLEFHLVSRANEAPRLGEECAS